MFIKCGFTKLSRLRKMINPHSKSLVGACISIRQAQSWSCKKPCESVFDVFTDRSFPQRATDKTLKPLCGGGGGSWADNKKKKKHIEETHGTLSYDIATAWQLKVHWCVAVETKWKMETLSWRCYTIQRCRPKNGSLSRSILDMKSLHTSHLASTFNIFLLFTTLFQ